MKKSPLLCAAIFPISVSIILFSCITLQGAIIEELEKDHSRLVVSPGAPTKIGHFNISLQAEGEIDPEPEKALKVLRKTIEDAFDHLLLTKYITSGNRADSTLVIRIADADKSYKFRGLRGLNYGYVRLMVNLVDNKTGETLMSGVSEGLETQTDTIFIDYWLRKRLFAKACEQAVERIAVTLREITQGEIETMHLEHPSFIEKSLAVLPLENVSARAKKEELGSLVSNMLMTEIGRKRTFIMLERMQVEKALEELNFGQSGYVASQSAHEIGKLTGADYLLVGSVASKRKKLEIDVRIVDAETGKVVATAGESVKGAGELREASRLLSAKLVSDCRKKRERGW